MAEPNPTPTVPSIPPLPMPTPDELDDLIYFSRTADLPSLQSFVTTLCSTHNCAPSTLLTACIDIDASGAGSENTLLHYAAANGHLDIITHLLSLLKPEVVHENGVSANLAPTVEDKSATTFVDHKNASGNTALHWASMNGQLEVVKALVEAGADVTVRNGAGQDAVFVAEVSGNAGAEECAEWLLKNCKGLDRGVGEGVEAEEEEGVESVMEGVEDVRHTEKEMNGEEEGTKKDF